MDNIKIGNDGEVAAIGILKDEGYNIIQTNEQEKHAPYDIIASKNGVTYAINVKNTSSEDGMFCIRLPNVERLIRYCIKNNYVASYMFLNDKKHILYTPHNVNWDCSIREIKSRILNRPRMSKGKLYDLFSVCIPQDLAKDSAFPFKDGDEVIMRVGGKKLVIQKG